MSALFVQESRLFFADGAKELTFLVQTSANRESSQLLHSRAVSVHSLHSILPTAPSANSQKKEEKKTRPLPIIHES